jgi:hypothetical protein
MSGKKYEKLMSEITSGTLENKWSDIMDKVEAVLKEEKMGTLDDMMDDIKRFMEAKGKMNDYINEEGVFKIPFELVFSWFRKAVIEHRKLQSSN